jgi:hypothetical protein
MKKPVLVLLILLALLPFAQLVAQAPPAAVPPAHSATAPTPDAAQFLATLSGQAQVANDWVPAPLLRTSCTFNSDCPSGKLCCNVCGTPPDDGSSCRACVTPIRGRCPLVG